MNDQDRSRIRDLIADRNQDGLTAALVGMVFRYSADDIEEAVKAEIAAAPLEIRHWWDEDCGCGQAHAN